MTKMTVIIPEIIPEGISVELFRFVLIIFIFSFEINWIWRLSVCRYLFMMRFRIYCIRCWTLLLRRVLCFLSVGSANQLYLPMHEVTFATIDKPKLLSQVIRGRLTKVSYLTLFISRDEHIFGDEVIKIL